MAECLKPRWRLFAFLISPNLSLAGEVLPNLEGNSSTLHHEVIAFIVREEDADG